MSIRTWLLFGTIMNLLVLLPAAFMAYSAVGFAVTYPEQGMIAAVAFLFVASPVFCLLGPFAAWRLYGKRADDRNSVVMVMAPLVYAAFLVVFLFNN